MSSKCYLKLIKYGKARQTPPSPNMLFSPKSYTSIQNHAWTLVSDIWPRTDSVEGQFLLQSSQCGSLQHWQIFVTVGRSLCLIPFLKCGSSMVTLCLLTYPTSFSFYLWQTFPPKGASNFLYFSVCFPENPTVRVF